MEGQESHDSQYSWIAEGLGLRQELGDPPAHRLPPRQKHPRGCEQGPAGRIQDHPLDVTPAFCICVFVVELLCVRSFLMKLPNIHRSRDNSTRNPVYSTPSFNNY